MSDVPSSASPSSISAPLWMKFWGVRGSIPTPGATTLHYGGNTSCIEVRAGETIIILDAGTGLRLLGRELVSEFGNLPLDLTLLLTHTHWDHIQGIPFFLPVYQQRNQLRILGYEGAKIGLQTVLNSQMESPFFPIGLNEVPANIRIEELKEWEFTIDKVRVQACYACHPGICVGYRLNVAGRSLAFFPDNEIATPEEAARDGGRVVVAAERSGSRLVEFIRGADVLVMDSQYTAEEYQKHIGWGHGCVDRVVELACEAGVKHLFLFHHDPNHDDAMVHQMVAHARQLAGARGSSLRVDGAREGVALEIAG